MLNIVYLTIAFFLDCLLGSLIGTNIVGTGTSFTPNFTFITLMILTYQMTFTKGLLLSGLVGLGFDFFSIDSMFMYMIIFVVCYLIMKAWKAIINDSFLEMTLLNIALVFVKEVGLFIYGSRSESLLISVSKWTVDHLLITLLLALLTILLLLFVQDQVGAIRGNFKYRLKKEERLSFRNY